MILLFYHTPMLQFPPPTTTASPLRLIRFLQLPLLLQPTERTYNDDDCFYYHSWRNNVVIAFGTLSSFLHIHMQECMRSCANTMP